MPQILPVTGKRTSFCGTLYRARAPETSQVGDNAEFIQTPIAVGGDEFSAVFGHLSASS